MEALLKLLSALLPLPNHGIQSLYKLRKVCFTVFPDIGSSPKYFCRVCRAPAKTKAECSDCGSKNVGRFFVADIGSQLKEKFKGVAIRLVAVCTYVFSCVLAVHVICIYFFVKLGL